MRIQIGKKRLLLFFLNEREVIYCNRAEFVIKESNQTFKNNKLGDFKFNQFITFYCRRINKKLEDFSLMNANLLFLFFKSKPSNFHICFKLTNDDRPKKNKPRIIIHKQNCNIARERFSLRTTISQHRNLICNIKRFEVLKHESRSLCMFFLVLRLNSLRFLSFSLRDLILYVLISFLNL